MRKSGMERWGTVLSTHGCDCVVFHTSYRAVFSVRCESIAKEHKPIEEALGQSASQYNTEYITSQSWNGLVRKGVQSAGCRAAW